MTRKLNLSVMLIALVGLLSLTTITFAAELPSSKNAVAKVYYVTSRKWDGKSFTSERGDPSKHSFGTCKVHFPNAETRWDIRKFFSILETQGWEQGTGLGTRNGIETLVNYERLA